MEELHLLSDKAEWKNLSAVQNQSVFIADYDLFTQPSARTLIEGIEVLAAVFHPEVFSIPQQQLHKVTRVNALHSKKPVSRV
jgi:iron complex transport system substrate-binding protein